MASKDLNLSLDHLLLWKEQQKAPARPAIKPRPAKSSSTGKPLPAKIMPLPRRENRPATAPDPYAEKVPRQEPAQAQAEPEFKSEIAAAVSDHQAHSKQARLLSIAAAALSFIFMSAAVVWVYTSQPAGPSSIEVPSTEQPSAQMQATVLSSTQTPSSQEPLAQASSTHPPRPASAVVPAEQTLQMEQRLSELSSANENQLQLIEQQITTLYAQLKEMTTQQNRLYLDLALQNQTVLKTLEKPAPGVPVKGEEWFINLGTFARDSSAQQLQTQLKGFGYLTEITSVTLNNKPAYRLRIAGFADRKSAEQAANGVMQKTDLHGLWVWKGE